MKVLGTELYDQGFDNLIEQSIQLIESPARNCLVSPSDANVLVEARRNSSFAKILRSFHWNLPDGVPSVWMLKLKGAKSATRCSGPDYFEKVIIKTKNKEINHFLCGGAPGVADNLKIVCNDWGNDRIVGTFCPPFKVLSNEEIEAIAVEINQLDTDVVWIGLGAPKQIYFADRLSKYTNVKMIVTIGAAFDFHTGRVNKAPQWLQKTGLEWLYRLLMEPKRLFKRYIKVVPLFIFYSILDLIRSYSRNN